MKTYTIGLFFKKQWVWFARPQDMPGVSVINVFSYDRVDVPGFKCKEGLTSVIVLSQSLEEIWQKMRKKFIREQIERGKRRGLTAMPSDDFGAFDAMYSRFTKQMSFEALSSNALRNGILFLAFFDSKPIAGGVFIADGVHIRALALASRRHDEESGRMRDIIGEANRLVVWEAIRYAKEKGYALFHLGGIAPKSSNTGWRAVADFKEAFGGERRAQYYYTKVYSLLLRAWIFLRSAIL